MNTFFILVLIGVLAFGLNRKNLRIMFFSIDIMLLSVTFLILLSLLGFLGFDDILGQIYAISIGLNKFVAFYRLRGSTILSSTS